MSDTSDRALLIMKLELGLCDEDLKPEARFAQDLNADSLDMVSVVIALEKEFDRDIPDEAAAKLLTVGDVLSYLEPS